MGGCISSNSKASSSKTINNIRVVHYNGYLENYEAPITVGQVTANVTEHFLCTPTQLMLHDFKPLMPDTELKSGHIYFLLPYSALQFEGSSVDLTAISKKLTNVAKTGISLSKSASTNSESSYHGLASPSASPYRSRSVRSDPGRSPNRFSNSYKGPSTRLEELNPTSPYRSTPQRSSSVKTPNRYSNSYASYKGSSTTLEELNPTSPYRSSPLRNSSAKSPNRYSNSYTISEGPSASLEESSPISSFSVKSPSRYSEQYVIDEENVADLQMSMKSPSWKPMLATIREKSVHRRNESDLQENRVQTPV